MIQEEVMIQHKMVVQQQEAKVSDVQQRPHEHSVTDYSEECIKSEQLPDQAIEDLQQQTIEYLKNHGSQTDVNK
ncbi:unnamed protein product, partial [Didymodactylos carnosus]